MFLSYTSTNRHLPSLTSGSRGVNSPPFSSTMEVLRLPSPISLPSVSLGSDTAALLPCFFVRGGNRYPEAPGLWFTGQPSSGISRGGGRLSQVPVETSCKFALLSDPGRHAGGSPYRRHCITAPTYQNSESSDNHKHFGAQSHSFPAPCLRFVPASQLTTQDSVLAAG